MDPCSDYDIFICIIASLPASVKQATDYSAEEWEQATASASRVEAELVCGCGSQEEIAASAGKEKAGSSMC